MNANSFAFLFPLCLGGIFVIVGVVVLILGLRDRKKAKMTESWPSASGTIISARLDQQTRTERKQGRTYTRTTYSPIVEYTYQVGGKAYQGNRIFPGSTLSYDLGAAQNIINRYQPGSAVNIHYDPSDSAQAVLETQSKGGSLFMIIGGVFAILGIVGCCIGLVMAILIQSS